MHASARYSLRSPVLRVVVLMGLGLGIPRLGPGLGAAQDAGGLAASVGVIRTYDARPLRRLDLRDPANAARVWDTVHLVAALQGLVNREAPRLYLYYCEAFGVDTDQFWFDWARSILKPPSWYAKVSTKLRREHGDLAIEVVDPYTFFGLVEESLR